MQPITRSEGQMFEINGLFRVTVDRIRKGRVDLSIAMPINVRRLADGVVEGDMFEPFAELTSKETVFIGPSMETAITILVDRVTKHQVRLILSGHTTVKIDDQVLVAVADRDGD